jgi:2-C-methyl-D-erythritol 4-phosphate cytidylyltransferase
MYAILSLLRPVSSMKASLIIVGAGEGRRMGKSISKTFIKLQDKPILFHTLDKFKDINFIKDIVVVLRKKDIKWALKKYKKLFIKYGIRKVVEGGKRRADSVYNGFIHTDSDSNLVVIHDAVRPFISKDTIQNVIASAVKRGAAIVAIPLADTLKSVKGSKIKCTIPRVSIWVAQTPQVFKKKILLKSYKKLSCRDFTDESSLVETAGFPVYVVLGNPKNLKITTQDDLVLARILTK